LPKDLRQGFVSGLASRYGDRLRRFLSQRLEHLQYSLGQLPPKVSTTLMLHGEPLALRQPDFRTWAAAHWSLVIVTVALMFGTTVAPRGVQAADKTSGGAVANSNYADDARNRIDNADIREALSKGMTLGFVLADFDPLYYRANRAAECPDGLAHTNRANWEAQFHTQAARKAHLNRCGDLQNRGPNCENVWFNPQAVADPLPFREVKGSVAYGVNLDGTQDGRATPNTCAHVKFVSPDSATAIDNQYYRFYGCERNRQFEEPVFRQKLLDIGLVYRLLLELKAVDDKQDDLGIEVTLYRGRDALMRDAGGNAVPWQSQRVAQDSQSVIFRVRGKMTGGILITEPIDVTWHEMAWDRQQFIRGMSLRIKFAGTGAEVLRVGYVDVNQMWEIYSREAAAAGPLFGASGPSAYAALHRLADGYKDPKTGECTALSSARQFEFVRAYVIHTSEEAKP
jgi:hypothetical protein